MKSNLQLQQERNQAVRARLAAEGYDLTGNEVRLMTTPNQTPRTLGRPVGSTKPIAHGTVGGYLTERNRGYPVCDDCRLVWNENSARRRREARARRKEHANA